MSKNIRHKLTLINRARVEGMKPIKHILHKIIRSRRGNALILAILTTMLLFIVGMVFLSSTIMEKSTIVNLDQDEILDNGVQQVIDKIDAVLAADMISSGLLNTRPYDYPGPSDPWLASSEPEIYYDADGTMWYSWPHITDLWGDFSRNDDLLFGNGSNYIFNGITFNNYYGPLSAYHYDPDFYDPADPTTHWMTNSQFNHDTSSDSHPYWVSAFNMVGKIIHEDTPIENTILDKNPDAFFNQRNLGYSDSWNGMRADADGDGIADSRWVVIPDSKTTDQDQWLWAAVRIVDNGGMLNLNTALRGYDPLDPQPTGDGSLLTDIDMESICRSDTPNPDDRTILHVYRCEGNPVSAVDYYLDVARRIKNPVLNPISGAPYTQFGLEDELEFRNRFFINTNVLSASERYWNKTFASPSNLTKSIPYFNPYPLDMNTLGNWYQKASFDLTTGLPDLYTRRHICTTYNFDRTISPRITSNAVKRWMGGSSGPGNDSAGLWRDWNSWQSSRGRPVSVNHIGQTVGNDTLSTKIVAGAIWLGIDDNRIYNDPNFIPLKTSNDPKWTNEQMRTRLACLMAVNLADYIDTDDPNTVNTIEDLHVYNSGGALQSTETYYGFESNMNRLYISKLGVCNYDDGSGGGTSESHYAVSLYNPHGFAWTATGWQLVIGDETIALPAFTIPAKDTVVLVDVDDPNSPPRGYTSGDFSQPLVEIGDQLNLETHKGKRMVLLHQNGTPVDAVTINSSIPSGSNPLTRTFHTTQDRTGYIVGIDAHIYAMDPEPSWDSNTDADEVEVKSAFTSATSITAKIQLACRNSGIMRNLGEIFNVLAIGGIKSELGGGGTNEYTTMSECWWRYIKYDKDGIGGDDNDIAVRFGGAGRFDAADGVQVGKLMQFLTVFAPFADGIDNDGNGLSDDPEHDGEDNNHDGVTDDSAETFANNYGEKYELNVAGRININTAPWFVIARLPWITEDLARAIVAYRDKKSLPDTPVIDPGPPARYLIDYAWPGDDPTSPDYGKTRKLGMGLTEENQGVREDPGFMYINELLNVTHDLVKVGGANYDFHYDIRQYGRDTINNDSSSDNNSTGQADYLDGPFFETAADDVTDDMEERDILFKRISNLVTVRSDVFTAYILVRLGRDGPQKRVIAIFDRSNVYGSNDKPKLIALHTVPDPR